MPREIAVENYARVSANYTVICYEWLTSGQVGTKGTDVWARMIFRVTPLRERCS